MATHFRTCPLCEATCGLAIETDGVSVTSIRGDEADPFSQGYICPKATALADLHTDPDRLKRPLVKEGGELVEVGWDEAFDRAARGLRAVRKRHGRDALAVYLGNPSVHNLGLMTWGLAFSRTLGTKQAYSATSADQLPHMLAAYLMFGNQLLMPVPDIDRTDHLLMFGANPVVSNGSIMTAPNIKGRLKALRGRGGKLVVFDPRKTRTAALADAHHAIVPGTDALALAAIINTLMTRGLANLGRLEPFTRGGSTLRAALAPFTPERVAARTGLSAETLTAIATEFGEAERPVAYGRMGLCTQEFGGLGAWLVNALNVITGRLDSPGGAMLTRPAVDLPGLAGKIGLRGSFRTHRSRLKHLPEFNGELPVSALVDEIDTPGKGQIRALVTLAGNPVLSIPNGKRLERALEGLEFMVSVDPFVNETTRHADVILPPTGPLEHDHYDLAFSMLMVRNVAKFAPPLFERGPDQRHDWEICLELMSRLSTGRDPAGRLLGRMVRLFGRQLTPRRIVDLGLRTGPYKLSVKKLLREPHGVDLGPLEPCLPERLRGHGIDLAPQPFLDDLARLRASLDRPTPELVLIGRRQLRSNNSWLHNSHRLVKGRPRCTLEMHPDDAESRGLEDGQLVKLRSRVGEVEAPLELNDDIAPGVVSLPHGWGHDREGIRLSVAAAHAGVSANDVTDETLADPLSGTAAFNGVPVEVAPA